MKKLIFILFILFCFALPSSARMVIGSGPTGAANKFYSDSFTYTDGQLNGKGSWVEAVGDLHIATNLVTPPTAGTDSVAIWNQACDTANQYGAIRIVTGGEFDYPGLVLRYTNWTTHYYVVQFNIVSNIAILLHMVGTTGTQIGGDLAVTVDAGDLMGVTITGTGASTVFNIWRNPTAPDGTNVAAANWAGDTTPDATYTLTATDVSNGKNVDTGDYTGFYVYNIGANSSTVDDWYGGDLD